MYLAKTLQELVGSLEEDTNFFLSFNKLIHHKWIKFIFHKFTLVNLFCNTLDCSEFLIKNNSNQLFVDNNKKNYLPCKVPFAVLSIVEVVSKEEVSSKEVVEVESIEEVSEEVVN
jgi:hypothetical protein